MEHEMSLDMLGSAVVSGRRNVGRKERFATWKLDTGVCGRGEGGVGGGGVDLINAGCSTLNPRET